MANLLPCDFSNIYQRYKDRAPEDSAHTIHIGRKADSFKFLDWIYKDATIYMNRKYRQYQELREKYDFSTTELKSSSGV